MRKFLERAMDKVSRMNEEAIRGLLRVLVDENDRLESVLDSMLDGIVVCGDTHVPILVNKAAERLLPLAQTELFDVPLWSTLRDNELSAFFRATLEGEESVLDREFALDTASGARILAISVTPLVKDKRIQGTLVHIEETTDKRKREVRLRRAESLASLTTLAAGVAHEIKNPLGSISIHVQLTRKALGSDGHPQVLHYLDVVNEEIERLNRIVVDFLFAVRPMDIAPLNDDPNALMHELVDFMRLEAEQSNVLVVESYARNAPLIPLDKRYLKQALLNLIKNALASMPNGGTLTLTTELAGDEFRIAVKDTGHGIPEDELGKIFDPYFTTKENGTGLGLTLAYKIVKEHRGEMTVRSKPGKGSIFIINLPIPQREQRMITDGDCGPRGMNAQACGDEETIP
ncbi:MAG: PAS domain S-box protein [Spirochaetales bacterium]|nr:MAG: PAS domain S-box protein [Spirochaetales bacterium]